MSRPAWCDNRHELVKLGDWLLHHSEEWEHLSAKDKLEELLSFFDKPWNYEPEYKLMTHAAFRCEDCDAICDVETDEQADRVEDGRACWCVECASERRAESYAASNPYFGGWR